MDAGKTAVTTANPGSSQDLKAPQRVALQASSIGGAVWKHLRKAFRSSAPLPRPFQYQFTRLVHHYRHHRFSGLACAVVVLTNGRHQKTHPARSKRLRPDPSITRQTRKQKARSPGSLRYPLALPSILLVTNQFVLHKDADAALDKIDYVLPLVAPAVMHSRIIFSDGLSEELISALDLVHDLKVIGDQFLIPVSRRTAGQPRRSGLKLGGAALLEGTVRKFDKQSCVIAALVRRGRQQQTVVAELQGRELRMSLPCRRHRPSMPAS